MTDIWELTPHSGQYYHSIATFFENGKVKTLQLANPNLYTMTYTLDGEGRWNSLTDTTSGQDIVTSATFYPAANPAVINLTGTTPDNDSYSFDSNTGRLTQFVFTVGNTPKSMTGALSWNPSGTLGQVAITDGFNSGGTQTCYSNSASALGYGYDDLNRLVEFDCGAGHWGQQYSYDQYDNLTKTIISGRSGSTWNPTYSSTTNHYACGGCTYDSNGDVTSDGNNVYGWNADSRLAWTASSGTPTCGSSGECITYDAFGRMVENSSGGSYNELWFTQLGASIQMAGSTIDFGYFPAPEGGTAIVNGNSSSYGYMHKDWLGNARIVSSITGHGATVDQAFTPYGEIYDQFGSTNSPYDTFANLTQNFAPGVMWDALNRELSVVSRWLSPDPAGQGWNQYSYPTNPHSFIDPTGLSTWMGNPYGSLGSISGYGSDAGFAFGFDPGPSSPWSSVDGPDSPVATVSDATNAYFDSLEGAQGDVTQERNDSEPLTPSWLDQLLNSFPIQLPVWQQSPSAHAGCTGPNIPCRLSRTPLGNKLYSNVFNYKYTIWDVNGNVVTDASEVSEFFSDGTGNLPLAGQTWNYDGLPLDSGNVWQGQFMDNLGGCCYTATQSFTVMVGGTSYVISTQAHMSVAGFGISTTTNAYNP